MLINLHVKNLALIKEADVDFSKGLIVLTGETGAGKSLLLGSVNIALGNKVSKDIIRTGAQFALVELTFQVDEVCASKLKLMDIFMEEGNIITVSRKISESRSVSKINGETVNVNVLKKVMGMLVDIHGQHEHQSLLYVSNHLNILDKYAKKEMADILKGLSAEYGNYTELKSRLSSYNIDEAQRMREIEFSMYEVNEIENANLIPGEDEELEEQYKKLSNSENIVETLSSVYGLIGYDSMQSAGELISKATQEISSISNFDEKINGFKETLFDIDSVCRDLSAEISDYTGELEYDPREVSRISERLDTINHLKLKYGKTIDDILQYQDKKQSYLDELNNYSEKIDQIKGLITESREKLQVLSERASKMRKTAAKELENSITDALKDLNFLSVDFKINITKKDKITDKGFDNVEFMISTNPGEPVRPLAKVASGGELSRIMLAIKSLLAGEDEIETLIFDEIDTGISGKTASMVAEKLAKISANHQVICISHLSQIAAMADSHYLIKKDMEDNSTATNIVKLTREESIKEIVRINGDGTMTDAAIAHAIEMKDMADRTKSNLV
ncbi:DNA repair protein RecN [Eubacterium sp. CAG:161]|uniref:DNA repair protein RecN n=1 Tax=Eubacterium sp. CAG:161 TaxID=1262881 RepID=UPI00033C848D|nr:DNA repair protein RecN [Eubacterium sp. CAG:161]CCY68440.1 dNA repair protein RecN [Eubacterium sp. CAG:161]